MIQTRDNRGRRSAVRPDLYLEGLAKEIGISSGYLSKLLRGIGSPSIAVAQRLARAMGVTVDDLMRQLSGTGQARQAGQTGQAQAQAWHVQAGRRTAKGIHRKQTKR